MANDVSVDPTIYGGKPLTNDAVPVFTPSDVASGTVQPYSPPEPVSQEGIAAGGMSAAIGNAAIAYNSRDIASLGDSAKAAVKSWASTRFLDYVNTPKFDADGPDFDVKPYVNSVPFTMTEDEHKFLAKSHSADEFNYKLDNLKQQHTLYQQMGDHPLLSTALSIADPIYFAIDLASMGTGSVLQAAGMSANAARVAAGITAAASTYGVGKAEQTQAAVSDASVIGNALFNGAASSVFYKAGKWVKHDADYPSDELATIANRMKGDDVGIERRVASESGDVAYVGNQAARDVTSDVPSINRTGITQKFKEENFGSNPATDIHTDAYSLLGKHVDDAEFGPMIRTLMDEQPDLLANLKVHQIENLKGGTAGDVNRGADAGRSFYHPADHTVYTPTNITSQGGRGAFTVLHEAVHGLTAQKIEYGLANPGTAHGKLVRDLTDLMAQVRDHIDHLAEKPSLFRNPDGSTYFTGDLHEFAAGLFAGKADDFTRILASIPVQGARNALTKMVDVVRKLLGVAPGQESALTKALGITDELMKQKLDVHIGTGVTGEARTTAHLAPAPSGTPAQQAATIGKRMDAAKFGQNLSWSLHRTMSKFGTAGRKVADLLVDDPVNMRGDSVISQKSAIRSDLAAKQYVFEDLLKDEMAKQGAGLRNRVMNSKSAAQVQRDIERKVYDELVRRDQAVRAGRDIHDPSVDPAISKMADAHGEATDVALKEMQASGVKGSEDIKANAGYATRKWSVTQLDDVENKLMQSGLTQKEARANIRDLVTNGMRRANPAWDPDTARDVATAILARTRAKGYFEDTSFLGHVGNAQAEQVRSILSESGISAERIQRAVDVITAKVDEGGKTSVLKRRIDIDMGASMPMGDGTSRTVTDLVDTNVTRNLENYLDNASGQAALARKGLPDVSSVDALRKEYLHGIDNLGDREKAAKLFDNSIANIKGNPTGEEVSDGMRKLAAVTQMVGLSGSGLWQVTEYATAMAKYGLVKTTKEILRTMPGFKQLMGDVSTSTGAATDLHNILTRNSAQDLRIRPYIQKMEDNFEMTPGDHAMLSLQQAKQIVPYINAMHYIHHNQANVVGNLVADTFHKAVGGNVKAIEALAQYGLEGHTLGSIRADVLKHGSDTSLWSDATWNQVRGPLSKMMDEAVLRNRTGEIPAFAQFSSVGKFIFTFRSFVLGAHNKVLAGTLGREGFSGLGLLMMYQFPLTMAATAAQTTLSGKPETDPAKLATLAVGQMGSLGLLSELWGAATGTKQQFGSSGLMAIDRLYKTVTAAGTGKYGTATANAINSIPLLSIIPGVKAMASTLKDAPTRKPKE